MSSTKFGAGDWFAVPLDDGRFAYGVVVVRSRGQSGISLGYFFGRPFDRVPTLPEVQGSGADEAVLVGHFTGVGIRSGRWPLLGQADRWVAHDWPNPVFVREEGSTGRYFRVVYDDSDPNRVIREELIPVGTAAAGPSDGLMGHLYVESLLSKLLS